MINVSYPNILSHISNHVVSGRTESAAFLIWYLENYYRLDTQEAVDSVCDQNGDKGVDGIYVDEINQTIDIFQTKISQNISRTIGDTVLKEFHGTLSQFDSVESVQSVIDSAGSAQVAGLIKRLQLISKIGQYRVRGVFISNIELDANGTSYLETDPNIEFIGKHILESTYISDQRDVPQDLVAEFDVTGINSSKYYVDADTLAVIAPIRASELVNMPGIADQSVFAYNVRGPLGKTNVNKDIVKSIKNRSIHKSFPLFHNGITIVTNKISEIGDKLRVETFFVVNGCQSLTTLYSNKPDLTGDLRILTKFVQVSVNSDLSRIITQYSNNQNGVKLRDFKSNHAIQIRLQNEFKQDYGNEFFYEIKRGEITNDNTVISNEVAGIYLMAFDLEEPWSTHRKYQVFDEKHSDLFGRPETSAHRILMIYLIDQVIQSKIPSISNQLVAKYILTRFVIIYILKEIFKIDTIGKEVLRRPENFVKNQEDRSLFIKAVSSLIDDIIIDFNGEVESLGEDFDYRSRLRDDKWVKKLSQDVVANYLKLVKRGRIESFEAEWISLNHARS